MTSAKVSHDDDNLDFGKLEKEAKNLVTYDERYWLENSAKFRAVEQRVASYDEFREMVMAAHLKPLEKEDKISSMGTFTQVWNQSAHRPAQMGTSGTGNDGNSEIDTAQPTMKIPQTGQAFQQCWKRECKTLEQKKQFLLAVGATKCQELFKTEISGGLLGDFVECLLHDFGESDTGPVVEILEALSTSQRFSLSLAFLSKMEKEKLGLLFEKLCCVKGETDKEVVTGLADRLGALRRVYSV